MLLPRVRLEVETTGRSTIAPSQCQLQYIFFCDQIREHQDLCKRRQRVNDGEYRLDAGAAQSLQVGTSSQVATPEVGSGGGKVGNEPQPANSGAAFASGDCLAHLIGK